MRKFGLSCIRRLALRPARARRPTLLSSAQPRAAAAPALRRGGAWRCFSAAVKRPAEGEDAEGLPLDEKVTEEELFDEEVIEEEIDIDEFLAEDDEFDPELLAKSKNGEAGEAGATEGVSLADLVEAKSRLEGLASSREGHGIDVEALEAEFEESVKGIAPDSWEWMEKRADFAVKFFAPELEKLTQEDIARMQEEDEAYFHYVAEEKYPDVWPKQPDLPFPVEIQEKWYMSEIVDLPYSWKDDEPEQSKKVQMVAKVADMGLTGTQADVLKELVGPRYDAETDSFKIVSTRLPSRELNYEEVMRLMWAVFNETKRLDELFQSDPKHYAEEVEIEKPPREAYRRTRQDHRPIKRQLKYERDF